MAKTKKLTFEIEQQCARCGNEWSNPVSLWFPFKKIRIPLCDICFYGLALGLKWDFDAIKKQRDAVNDTKTDNS